MRSHTLPVAVFASLGLLISACGSDDNLALDGSGATLNGWQTYEDLVAGFSFSYPMQLKLSSEGQAAVLHHEVPHDHADPCDFSGGGERLKAITDAHISFEMLEKTLRDAVIQEEGSDYVATQYMRGDEFILDGDSPVERVSFGDLDGYRITSGVEGCGRYTYYFLSPSGRTLVVQRRFVPEFSSVNPDADTLQELPGILHPEQEEMLFTRMMSTVAFRS